MKRIVLTLTAGAALAACGAAGTTPSSSNPGSGTGASTTATVSSGTTTLGTVLTDASGLTLYYFLPEKNATVGACAAGCLSAWPPLVVTGAPTSSSAVTGTLGTVSIMVNGAAATEVTYNGWPLHTFASDSGPKQTGGNGVEGTWFAAMPGTTSTETGATTGSSATTPAPTSAPAATSAGGYGY
jgi:predicted lipoprotein with Yx(FWY)xxD motif